MAQPSIEDEWEAINDLIQTWRANCVGTTTDSSSTRDARTTNFDWSMIGIEPFPMYGRGRTPERVEHSRYSPQSGPASRANSTSSARSMIDERLEWAHQDRMRSVSRDRSVPASPFHENSPFYAEFAKELGRLSPFNDDESRKTMAADLSHEPGAQSRKHNRVNPSTSFYNPYNLTGHENTIHNNRQERFRCPLCSEVKHFAESEALTQHIRAVHPESRRSYWSCAALARPEHVISQIRPVWHMCAYCRMWLRGSVSDGHIADHLDAHQFRKCDPTKKFYRLDQFRRHLEQFHAASGTGTWDLSTKCFCHERLDQSAMDTTVDASHASFKPTSSTTSPEEPQFQWSDLPAQPRYMCKCCPKKPKMFDTKDDLRVHESMKVYNCDHCPSRFKSLDEILRHQNSCHAPRHSWSCAALTDPQNAIVESFDGTSCCGYCGMEFQGCCIDEDVMAHLRHEHKFDDCNKAKKFFRADHFRQHLRHSHGAIYFNTLETACMKDEPPSSESGVATGVGSAQAQLALQSATASMTRLSKPDEVPPPLPPPTYYPELSTTPCSDGHLVNHDDTANLGDSAALYSSSGPSGIGLTSPGLSSGRSKRVFGLLDAASNDSVPNKRRMSSSVSESAKDDWLTFPAVVTESNATYVPMKLPDTPLRSSSVAAEESKPEPQHVCSTCQRSFKKRTVLTNHERTHTGEKPFSCTFEGCSQAFAQQGDKTRHEKAQHSKKTFRCGNSDGESPSWGCRKKFPRKDGLLEHHTKTKKGKQCLADRDKLMELGKIGDEDSPAFE